MEPPLEIRTYLWIWNIRWSNRYLGYDRIEKNRSLQNEINQSLCVVPLRKKGIHRKRPLLIYILVSMWESHSSNEC